MKVTRPNKDIAVPSRSTKLQTPAVPVRVLKRTSASPRSMKGSR